MVQAVENNDLSTLETLLGQDQEPSVLQEAIRVALNLGHSRCLEKMIETNYSSLKTPGDPRVEGQRVTLSDAFWYCHEWSELQALVKWSVSHGEVLVSARDPCGRSALHLAVQHKDVGLCRQLLRHVPNMINVQNSSGHTALHVAVMVESRECLKILLDNGADVNIAAEDKSLPLFEAVLQEDVESIRDLLAAGAVVEATDGHGFTVLHQAISQGRLECVRVLLDQENLYLSHRADAKGAHMDATTCPLAIAIERGSLAIVKLLLDRGVSPDVLDSPQGWAAVHYAAAECPNPACLKELLSRPNVDVNRRTRDGRTALMLAVSYGQCDLLAQILHHLKCDVNAVDHQSRMSALHRAADAGCRRCTMLLLQAGALPDQPDADSATPLLLAVNSRRADLIPDLLLWGQGRWPWLSPDEDGPVINMALQRGYWDIAKALLLSGWCLQSLESFIQDKTHNKSNSQGSLLNSYPRWLQLFASEPLSLKHLCRLQIKIGLGLQAPVKFQKLPLPSSLLKYVAFGDLPNDMLCAMN